MTTPNACYKLRNRTVLCSSENSPSANDVDVSIEEEGISEESIPSVMTDSAVQALTDEVTQLMVSWLISGQFTGHSGYNRLVGTGFALTDEVTQLMVSWLISGQFTGHSGYNRLVGTGFALTDDGTQLVD